jgi:hypothetical protein
MLLTARKLWQAAMAQLGQPDQAPPFAPTGPDDAFASLPYVGLPKTLEGMDAGVAAEARRRHRRSTGAARREIAP